MGREEKKGRGEKEGVGRKGAERRKNAGGGRTPCPSYLTIDVH